MGERRRLLISALLIALVVLVGLLLLGGPGPGKLGP